MRGRVRSIDAAALPWATRWFGVVLASFIVAPHAAAREDVDAETAAILAMPADPAYGAYLAGECVTCHRVSGDGGAIPQIAGLPSEAFIRALLEYRVKARDNQIMTTIAGALNHAELAALAAYFGSLQPR